MVKQKGKFISTDHIGRIRHHLLSGRWSRKATSLAQITWEESDITYYLEGEGKRQICQHRSHGENQTSLTIWKVKGKGKFVSTDHMGRIRHHLLPGRWKEKVNLSAQITWQESDIIYSLEGEGKRWIHQRRSHGRIRCHWLPGRLRGRVNLSAQIT